VFVIKDNKATKRVVIVGLQNDKESQILKGLSEGEQVAVTNVRALADATPVTLQK
jgi:HlyD family secretion protein